MDGGVAVGVGDDGVRVIGGVAGGGVGVFEDDVLDDDVAGETARIAVERTGSDLVESGDTEPIT